MELLAADIGGTHARFAIAEVATGQVTRLGEPLTLRVADFASLGEALAAVAAARGDLPRAAAFAVAGPVDGPEVRLTNAHWTFDRAALGLDRLLLVNDFAAVAHAVAIAAPGALAPVAGPAELPEAGVVTVLGPGTGLGVAQLLLPERRVIATEAAHIGFAPCDDEEDRLLAALRPRFGRVSVERLASGPGLALLHGARGGPAHANDAALWAAALGEDDAEAAASLARWCAVLGSAAGDLALAHGAAAVVLAGSLAARLAPRIGATPFAECFVAKGRFAGRMAGIPVLRLADEVAGLRGAAAAFAATL